MIINLVFTADDIIRHVYLIEDKPLSSPDAADKIKAGTAQVQADLAADPKTQSNVLLQRAKQRFALFKPEIQAVGTFFTDPRNLTILQIFGKEIFWVDSASLAQIAKQYQDNISIAFDDTSSPEAANMALNQLLERTKIVIEDFRDILLLIKSQENQPCPVEEAQGATDKRSRRRLTPNTAALGENEIKHLRRVCAIERIAQAKREDAFDELKKLFAAGMISLRSAKAADGDLLTVRIDAVGADGANVGIPAVFEIDIKKFGAKIQWSPSFLFLRRLGVTDSDVTPPVGSTEPPLTRVNFAPSPGTTFGIAYFKRGDSKGNTFLRALGPGVGMNVSFMNFNDPSFDLAANQFVNTSGTNVQVGAGIIGSLFDNKLQLTYGWNLNVERRRTYFGVGFGFIEIGKELTKHIAR